MRAALLMAAILGGSTTPAFAGDAVNLLTAVPTVVVVSSTVDNRTILPEHLVDGKLDTAWNSRTDDLTGSWVGVRVPEGVRVSSIRLTVGFTKVDKKLGDLFTMNPRITRVVITRNGERVGGKELDPALRTLQEIPVDNGGPGDFKVEIEGFVLGTKKSWRELSISELEVWGTLTTATAKPQKPTVRVGSFDPQVLSQGACVKALYPAAKGGRIDADPSSDKIVHVEALMVGSADVCRVDHLSTTQTDADTVVEIAAVKRAPRPSVIARLPPLAAFKHDEMEVRSEAVTLSDFALTTRQTALVVTDETSDIMPGGGGSGTTASRLYRIGAADLTPLIEVTSDWRAGETGDSTKCELRPIATPTAAMPPLVVTCESVHDGYPGDKADHDRRSSTTETYRWKGNAYVKK